MTNTVLIKHWTWKWSIPFLIISLALFLFNYQLTINLNTSSLLFNDKDSNDDGFIHITDSDEVANHLRSLGLTPHHSIEYLTPQDFPNEDGTHPYVKRTLHGRFLHITDMHPDELNVVGAAIKRECHKKIKKLSDNESISHKYGDALSGCDSPMGLYEETLKWIKLNLKDHIDFVIWTGDNIRHDNDRDNPRFEAEIFDMNERVANDMSNTFLDDNEQDLLPIQRRVKIIPSLGNNDVYPHNLFAPGPTLQTREMFKLWRDFIPSEQMHTFDRGAYFLREVIPDKLVVISINTLYWFMKNPLNDNCNARKQPGYKLFLWLGAALKECRNRGVKVWLSGHVPPIPNNIHNSCYSKMGVWLHEYSDVIIGGVWGHMNLDHWVPIDGVKSWKSIRASLMSKGLDSSFDQHSWLNDVDWDDEESIEDLYMQLGLLDLNGEHNFDKLPFTQRMLMTSIDDQEEFNTLSDRYMGAPNNKVPYLEDIRDTMYAKLKGKKKSGNHFERYGIAHISASVIPTYNPGMRVWEYNVKDLLNETSSSFSFTDFFKNLISTKREGQNSNYVGWQEFFNNLELELQQEDQLEHLESIIESQILNSANSNEVTNLKNQLVSLYSLKNDKTIPKPKPIDADLGPGYISQALSPLRYTQLFIDLDNVNYGETDIDDWEFKYKVQYSTDDDVYDMESLLVSDWIKLGKKLAKMKSKNNKGLKAKSNKLWNTFLNRAFVSCGYESLDPDKE